MTNSDPTHSTPPNRKAAIEEEQQLCNDALLSGAYDNYSEQEWHSLCEKAHQRGRKDSTSPSDS